MADPEPRADRVRRLREAGIDSQPRFVTHPGWALTEGAPIEDLAEYEAWTHFGGSPHEYPFVLPSDEILRELCECRAHA
jgi:hypothetical protein